MDQWNLPASAADFAGATWDDLLPYYEALRQRPLTSATAAQWLQDWSTLDALVAEAASQAGVDYTCDTTDPTKEEAYLRFTSAIMPKLAEQRVLLAGRLLDLGYSRPDLETTLRRFRNQQALFRAENVPLRTELQEVTAHYPKRTGRMTVEWDGEELTIPQVRQFLESPDRATRERAFRAQIAPYIEAHDELAGIFDRQYALRQQIARNAGYPNYRDFAHQEKHRFDYTPDDCARFHEAIEATFVPATLRRQSRRASHLGLDILRPWDTDCDPHGREPLRPFENVAELIAGGRRIYEQVDPSLARYFATMAEEHLLDLDSRKGKAPGGYCTGFPHRQRPFIFMNAVGTAGDVNTLLHEAGHAFHFFEASSLPFLFQRHPGSEMAEVASMSMELLTAPYLGRAQGGFYDEEDERRARIDHLEGILAFMPHCAAIDAFQQWIYTSPDGGDSAARDANWLRIRGRFERGIDWSDLEQERIARWYQQIHIFEYPFYYVEYGIAQLGALQVWRNSKRDPERALADYRRALALGATAPLPELFATAGARLAFDAEMMSELVALLEEELAQLDGWRDTAGVW